MKIRELIDRLLQINLTEEENPNVTLILGDDWNGYATHKVFKVQEVNDEDDKLTDIEIFGETN